MTSKGTVAILHKPSISKCSQADATTWTLEDCTAHYFTANLYRSLEQAVELCDLKIILDRSGRSVVIFERVIEAKAVYFTRFSLENQVQAKGTVNLPCIKRYTMHSEKTMPTVTNEWATIWSYSTTKENESRSSDTVELLGIQYIPDRDVMQLREDTFVPYGLPDVPMSNIFFWNDIGYCQAGSRECLSLNIIDLLNAFMLPAVMGRGIEYMSTFPKSQQLQFLTNGGMLQSLFLGDERFLVNAYQHGFIVWAFEKDHEMAGRYWKWQRRKSSIRGDAVGLASYDYTISTYL